MLMDVRMYNVKANSQKGIIYVYLMTMKKATAPRCSAWGLKNFCILPENLAGSLRAWRERCWLGIYLSEYTWKANSEIYLPLKVASTLLSGSWKSAFGA